MFRYIKKQFIKILIKHKLKELGVKGEYHATIANAGADVYIIYMLVRKLIETHGEPIKTILKNTTPKVDIDQVLENIKEGWNTDESDINKN